MRQVSLGKAVTAGAVVGLGVWAAARRLHGRTPVDALRGSGVGKVLGVAALLPGTPGAVARVALTVIQAKRYFGR